jgi:hypothetical protein
LKAVFKHYFDFFDADRAAVIIALNFIASSLTQKLELRFCLYAFRDDF